MLSEQRNPCTDCKSAHQCTNRENLLLFPKLHLGPCSSVGVQRGTDTQTGMNNIHFASSMTHVKCNHSPKNSCCGMEVVDLTPEHSVSCIMAEKIVVSVTTEFMTLQLRWQLTVVTLTLNALGDKTPEKIGTKVTPVRPFECMQLQNTQQSGFNDDDDDSNNYCNSLTEHQRRQKKMQMILYNKHKLYAWNWKFNSRICFTGA